MSVVLLVSLALALLLAWLAALGLSALGSVTRPGWRLRGQPSTRLRALVVLLPAIIALMTLVVVLMPSPLAHCHCADHGGGHPHLCIRHPWLALPLASFATPVTAIWLGFSLIRVWGVLRDLAQGERWVTQLRSLPVELADGVPIRFVEALGLGAFTVGLWRPVVAVDRTLWQRLDPLERLAVVHHEHAHAARGDALTQACLRLLCALLPWSVARGAWLGAWRSASELCCDRHAALKLGDATIVAKALVSVERLRAEARAVHEPTPALAMAAGGDLAPRVRALLDDERRELPPLTNDLRPIGLGLLALALLLAAWPGASLHHAAESLLGFLTHH